MFYLFVCLLFSVSLRIRPKTLCTLSNHVSIFQEPHLIPLIGPNFSVKCQATNTDFSFQNPSSQLLFACFHLDEHSWASGFPIYFCILSPDTNTILYQWSLRKSHPALPPSLYSLYFLHFPQAPHTVVQKRSIFSVCFCPRRANQTIFFTVATWLGVNFLGAFLLWLILFSSEDVLC